MEQLKNLRWGSFSKTHIITLILSLVIIAALYLILRKKSEKIQRNVLFILSLTAPAAVIYNILLWGTKSTVLEYLPLHLCSINALLLPFMVFKKNEFLGNLLPVYSVGAVAALVFNYFQADFLIFDHVFLMYYIPHTLEFGIPMLMLAFGLVKIKPKYILPCILTTFGLYTIVHFCNLLVNKYLEANPVLNSWGGEIRVNYMYSLSPDGNPALVFFYNILPKEYFYLLLTLPIFLIVYGLMNIKAIIGWFKAKRR